MKTIPSMLLLAVLLYAGGCAAQPAPSANKPRNMDEQVPEKYRALFTTWLNQDCRVDAGDIVNDMIVAGPVLEEPLWAAFERGPGEVERAELEDALGERYALRFRWLKQNGEEAVKPPLLQALLEETEEQFRAEEMEKLVIRWRDAAITGLALVCSERSLERLRKLAEDEKNPSSLAAGVALKESDNCARSGAPR
jgi:hypothetical protein